MLGVRRTTLGSTTRGVIELYRLRKLVNLTIVRPMKVMKRSFEDATVPIQARRKIIIKVTLGPGDVNEW